MAVGSDLFVRDEQHADFDAVRLLTTAAFERDSEALLVDRLRRVAPPPLISLVAELERTIVGHIFFTAVDVKGDHHRWQAMALGPMAVAPQHQRQGIGSALVEHGTQRCADLDMPAVFVLGHPTYYTRLGFMPASQLACRCTWEVPDEVFMVRTIDRSRIAPGVVNYHSAFDEVT